MYLITFRMMHRLKHYSMTLKLAMVIFVIFIIIQFNKYIFLTLDLEIISNKIRFAFKNNFTDELNELLQPKVEK